METYIGDLSEKMEIAVNPVKAIGAKQYMKNQFEFLGVDSSTRRKILSEFLKEKGIPVISKLSEFCFLLWDKPEREYQYVAIDVLQKIAKKLNENDIEWLEQLIMRKPWWDTVDGLAASICGIYFQLYPEQIEIVTGKWIQSGNIWLERSALLFQLKYKKQTNTTLLSKYIEELTGSREFFINKAIGWVLREYSKSNKEWVRRFVDTHSLAPLSYREATKYL
jgi:3-methyladenine DNA glycosylase AlkD